MGRIRGALIVWIALAYASAPLALDACARSCARTTPACHHESSTSAHIGHAPDLCGNDHDAVRSPATNLKSSNATVALALISFATLPDGNVTAGAAAHGSGRPPRPDPPPSAATPLRV